MGSSGVGFCRGCVPISVAMDPQRHHRPASPIGSQGNGPECQRVTHPQAALPYSHVSAEGSSETPETVLLNPNLPAPSDQMVQPGGCPEALEPLVRVGAALSGRSRLHPLVLRGEDVLEGGRLQAPFQLGVLHCRGDPGPLHAVWVGFPCALWRGERTDWPRGPTEQGPCLLGNR